MRTLQKGREQAGWSFMGECTGNGHYGGVGGTCYTRLLVSELDLFVTVEKIGNETTYYYTYICKECGCMTDVDKNIIPNSVKENLIKKWENMTTEDYEKIFERAEQIKQEAFQKIIKRK